MSLKRKIIKLALSNEKLRPHLAALLFQQEIVKKGDGVWLEEFIEGEDEEKALEKLREKDLEKLKERAIEKVKQDQKLEKVVLSQDQSLRGEALHVRLKKIKELRDRALSSIEKKFSPLIKEAEKQVKEYEKEIEKEKNKKTKELDKKIDEIKKFKQELPEDQPPGPLQDLLLSEPGWSQKFNLIKLTTRPVAKKEAEALARGSGLEMKLTDQDVLVVPIGEKDKIEGWCLFTWSPRETS